MILSFSHGPATWSPKTSECDNASKRFGSGDLKTAGRLMTASHISLRDDYEVSTPDLDSAVENLISTPGVYGARLTGAGFGGCVIALTKPGAVTDAWVVRAVDGAEVVSGGSNYYRAQ